MKVFELYQLMYAGTLKSLTILKKTVNTGISTLGGLEARLDSSQDIHLESRSMPPKMRGLTNKRLTIMANAGYIFISSPRTLKIIGHELIWHQPKYMDSSVDTN